MLSIEEIKLLIEKLEKVKKEDLQELIDSNLKILKEFKMVKFQASEIRKLAPIHTIPNFDLTNWESNVGVTNLGTHNNQRLAMVFRCQ